MIVAIIFAGLVVAISTGLVVREWLWLRRVRRASGDPDALFRVLARRQTGGRGSWRPPVPPVRHD